MQALPLRLVFSILNPVNPRLQCHISYSQNLEKDGDILVSVCMHEIVIITKGIH